MFSARFKAAFGSLRFRLLVWNTLVALLLIAVCLLLVRQTTYLARFELLDDFLAEEMASVAAQTAALSGQPEALQATLDRRARNHPRQKMFIQLLDAEGNVRWSSTHSPETPIAPSRRASREKPTTQDDYRFLERRLPAASGSFQRVRLGVSLDHIHEEMALLTEIVVSVGAVFLLLCPAAAFFLTDRAMRPLARIVATTNRIVPGNLDERLPLPAGGNELDQISVTINNLLDRLNQFIQLNRNWLTDAAHELRSPLAGIHASLELAASHERTPEQYREVIGDVIGECDSLITTLNKMLLLGEADGGVLQVQAEPVALDRLIERSLDRYQAVAEVNRINLRAAPLEPLAVTGDRQLLSQVLNNLLDNALKYTPPGGDVTVKLSSSPEDRTVILQVIDTGTGIPPQDVPMLFQRFFRGDKSRTQSGGHGLGLGLCRTFVRAHGGSIDVASTPGKGSTFTVVLPLDQGPCPGAKLRPHSSAEPTMQR